MKVRTKYLLVILISAAILAVVICFSIEIGDVFTKRFNDIASGIGIFLAGLGGAIAFWEWVEKQKRRDKFIQVRDAYPSSDLKKQDSGNGRFELVKDRNSPRIYIHDFEPEDWIWIKDGHTYRNLGYPPGAHRMSKEAEDDMLDPGNYVMDT